jgi:hypothetical protein
MFFYESRTQNSIPYAWKFFLKKESIDKFDSSNFILFIFFKTGTDLIFWLLFRLCVCWFCFFFYGAHPEITKRSLGIDMNFFCFYPERNAIINQKLAIVYSVTAACNGIVPKQLSRQTLFLYTHRGLGCWVWENRRWSMCPISCRVSSSPPKRRFHFWEFVNFARSRQRALASREERK